MGKEKREVMKRRCPCFFFLLLFFVNLNLLTNEKHLTFLYFKILKEQWQKEEEKKEESTRGSLLP